MATVLPNREFSGSRNVTWFLDRATKNANINNSTVYTIYSNGMSPSGKVRTASGSSQGRSATARGGLANLSPDKYCEMVFGSGYQKRQR